MLRRKFSSGGSSSSQINNIIDYAVVVWNKENEESIPSILCSASILTPNKLITTYSAAATINNEIQLKKSNSNSEKRQYVTFGPLDNPLHKEYEIKNVLFPDSRSADFMGYGIIKVSDDVCRARRVKRKFILSAIYRILQNCAAAK